jgi:hypothetical protein
VVAVPLARVLWEGAPAAAANRFAKTRAEVVLLLAGVRFGTVSGR